MRDLDVAIDRLKKIDKTTSTSNTAIIAPGSAKRADIHRRLARALRSARYQRLVQDTSDWIERGPWSIRKGKAATVKRASPIAAYSVRKLTKMAGKTSEEEPSSLRKWMPRSGIGCAC